MPSCCWICCRYNDDRTWTNFICRFFALIFRFFLFVAVFQFSVFPRCRRFHSLDFWFFFLTLVPPHFCRYFNFYRCFVYGFFSTATGVWLSSVYIFCYKLISTFSSWIQHVYSIHEWSIEQFFSHSHSARWWMCPFNKHLHQIQHHSTPLLILGKHATSGGLWMHFALIFSFNLCTFLHFPRIFRCRNSLLFMWCCFVCSDHNRFSIWILKRTLFFLNSMNNMGKPVFVVCWVFERSIENWFEHNSFEKGIFWILFYALSSQLYSQFIDCSRVKAPGISCCVAALRYVGLLE